MPVNEIWYVELPAFPSSFQVCARSSLFKIGSEIMS
jgi:hypothetical protein